MRTESLIAEAGQRLLAAGIDNGSQEARWLMLQLVGDSHLCPADQLPAKDIAIFNERVQRRIDGEPLQYIMGNTPFHCIDLEVGPGVLIPRPETEQLVDHALELYKGQIGPVCDLCTGSGAIALALATQLRKTHVTGIDISEEALAYARKNMVALGLPNVTLLLGDLFAPLPTDARFAMITANPPYVSPDDYDALDPVVKNHEPRLALLADEQGLAVIRRIATDSRQRLLPGAPIILEIGDEQGAAVARLFRQSGYDDVAIRKDYAGKDRFLVARQPAHSTPSHCGTSI